MNEWEPISGDTSVCLFHFYVKATLFSYVGEHNYSVFHPDFFNYMDREKPQNTVKNELRLEHPSQLLAAPNDSTKHFCAILLSSLMFPKAGPQKDVQKGKTISVLWSCFFNPGSQPGLFFYCFPEIKPVTASCPLLSWTRGLMVLLFFSNHAD